MKVGKRDIANHIRDFDYEASKASITITSKKSDIHKEHAINENLLAEAVMQKQALEELIVNREKYRQDILTRAAMLKDVEYEEVMIIYKVSNTDIITGEKKNRFYIATVSVLKGAAIEEDDLYATSEGIGVAENSHVEPLTVICVLNSKAEMQEYRDAILKQYPKDRIVKLGGVDDAE